MLISKKKVLLFIAIVFFALSVFWGFQVYLALGSKPHGIDKKAFERSHHFHKQKEIFFNRNTEALSRLSKRRKVAGGWVKFFLSNENDRAPKKELPVLKPNLKSFLEDSPKIKVIWFGHSTFMLKLNGKVILIDPVLSQYASPIFFLLRRFQDPPLNLEELPQIDYILISHDHYDHLDMPTIRHFKNLKTKFVVPLGVGSQLRGWGIERERIQELDWWQSIKLEEGFEFVAAPAQHYSGRSYNDRNATLWASWIILTETQRIYFSGDSGYDNHFQEIGKRYGPFDVAFLENGQYNKQWKEVHLMPEEGVKAFFELKAKVFFPVHWGAFKLSIHPWYEPAQNIYQFSLDRKFPVIVPKVGEIVTIDESYQTHPWWRELM